MKLEFNRDQIKIERKENKMILSFDEEVELYNAIPVRYLKEYIKWFFEDHPREEINNYRKEGQ